MVVKKRVVITVINNLVTDYRVAKLAGSLEKRGYDVLLIGRKWPDAEIPQGRAGSQYRFNCPVNKGFLFYMYFNIALFWVLLFKRLDFIISVDLDTLLACRLAGVIKRKPVVFDSHEYMPETPEVKVRPWIQKLWVTLEKILIPGVKQGFTVSRGLQQIYLKKYNRNLYLLRNIPLATKVVSDIRPFTNTPIVYYQGALNVGRGLESSILAMKYLPHYKLVIAGSGDIENELKELVQKENLVNQVTFLGRLPFEELSAYATRAHVGLCLLENIGLNYFHSLPNRIFDYPAMGLPVIATSFPDISEVVKKYNTGLLVDTLNPRVIADVIKEACESIELRSQWAVSLPLALQELNWNKEEVIIDKVFPNILDN